VAAGFTRVTRDRDDPRVKPQVGKLIVAAGIAAVLACTASVPSVAGIETWKILLALLGLFLVTIAGPASRPRQ
jgi:peptidoglycan/LPS O-acetylase OafA/YrhL